METKKESILIIAPPFGYNTDWYQFAELLCSHYNVYYLCVHSGTKDIEPRNVNVVYYVATTKNYYYKVLFAVKALKREMEFRKVFVYVYPSCSLMRLFFSKKQLVMDIRTSYIKSPVLTWVSNRLVKVESVFYGKISVISWGVADFLKLNKKKCELLPLGGERLEFVEKSFDELNLFYVGTFFDRHIEKTVEAFEIFKRENPEAKAQYGIVGNGSDEDLRLIEDNIKKYNLEKSVFYLGAKRGEELHNIMTRYNVGLSYIPLTDYYDCQPPTKTYEYLLGSMIVLATPTTENIKVVNDTNGCISKTDTPQDIAIALQKIYEKRKKYNAHDIYVDSLKYAWEEIVRKYLLPLC